MDWYSGLDGARAPRRAVDWGRVVAAHATLCVHEADWAARGLAVQVD